ncbi:F0F1 ATP synthase subunit gamma [Leptolyngbya cf. ectocarpi LEGE 11479]|uniref:F0F1 ATP synthase subunit gamma n=1 Tax=Leptolyngbya cf. ectocarpi LEGE 11479 TaxID=1828722 RepID=A0A928ZTR7_LEPEC|nr:F0F1 ATP synthase subunit gamma [Leptolyngbya ectocarpi]MBE9066884.1 F0F1 ATP synthase subunit gamma [Leptolyngbya cf. ectocarpi LEGE 11479]
MTTLESLQRKIKTADDLQSVVKTMKSLAAVSIHQYENAVVSLADHSQVLAMALQVLMINLPEALSTQKPTAPKRLGIVIFGSDQGMCGCFNSQLVEFVDRRLERLHRFRTENKVSAPTVLAVGSRVVDSLITAGYPVDQCLSVSSSLGGITPLVQQIVLQLESWRQNSQVDHIWVFHNRPTGGTTSSPTLLQLFPISYLYLKQLEQQPWPSRCRPQVKMDYERLFSAIFQQHFFIGLYRACAESLASENASRLAAMQVAEKNIDERLQALKVTYQQQRQDAITEEILDIVAGFEAIDF